MKDVFVARQPIFDSKKNVSAYELLFRSSIENFCVPLQDGDQTTNKLLSNSFLVIGLDSITKGKRAFVNFTRNLILQGAPSSIPKELIAVEILENVEPDNQVVNVCKELKGSGYMLVLDDFVFDTKFWPLIELADIIKVDFLTTKGEARRAIIEECGRNEIKFLAEKVETVEEFTEARNMGYTFFQGYFFSKPIVISSKDISSNKLSYLRVLHEINRPDMEFNKLEEIVKHDVALSYKLLKFINSTFFRLTVKVESIKHALVLLGIKEIRKWVSLIALGHMAVDKPQELLVVSLIRARFCESVAVLIGQVDNASDFFMMGLFSVIDALLDRPMKDVLTELPISDGIKEALVGKENILHDVYRMVLSYEKGDWESINQYLTKLNLSEKKLPDFYIDSVKWANMAL